MDQNGTSVSGLSAGAFFAVQMHVAFSDFIVGAGVFAGGRFNDKRQNTRARLHETSCTRRDVRHFSRAARALTDQMIFHSSLSRSPHFAVFISSWFFLVASALATLQRTFSRCTVGRSVRLCKGLTQHGGADLHERTDAAFRRGIRGHNHQARCCGYHR